MCIYDKFFKGVNMALNMKNCRKLNEWMNGFLVLNLHIYILIHKHSHAITIIFWEKKCVVQVFLTVEIIMNGLTIF